MLPFEINNLQLKEKDKSTASLVLCGSLNPRFGNEDQQRRPSKVQE